MAAAFVPPLPPDDLEPREHLGRALANVPAALARAVVHAVGNVVHPSLLQVVLQAIQSTINRERTLLLEAAAADANTQPLVDALIAESLDHVKNTGLVHWIREASARSRATAVVTRLREHMEMRHGNYVRSEFQDLLRLYMETLGLQNDSPQGYLGEICVNLRNALQAFSGNDELGNAARGVNRVGWSVREVTNKYSHPPAKPMSDPDVYELCGCFQALGAAMPVVAAELYSTKKAPPLAPDTASSVSSRTASTVSSPMLTPNQGDPLQLQQIQLLQQLLDTLQTNPTTAASVVPLPPPQAPTRGWETVPTAPTAPRAPRRPVVSRPTAKVPTRAALDAAATYHLYHDRPMEPLERETDKTRLVLFKRMLNHTPLVAKATLCRRVEGMCDATCARSHSYLEVMSYNPLYKLLPCRCHDHYWRRDVAEDNVCVGRHVDTGFDAFETILQAKSERCSRGARCDDQSCCKSHSFEEMCWYNPQYKTKKCGPQRCTRSARECLFAHEGETVREWKTEDDYVGKNVKMLFPERTHQALADALEAVRFARNPW